MSQITNFRPISEIAKKENIFLFKRNNFLDSCIFIKIDFIASFKHDILVMDNTIIIILNC